ncbi:Piso0_004088 [Millerozyma farinosa CBS 7064]|uniref:MICOS complex subunit n=1 Tax=Pichia sorbitophila (strain ATCC MYA-4447 / BCRC 22081 / CBS 7064 / NBRC 10061 / NRRL Y-12695) TaxID=559304 RepID=G8YAC7_PICSO|nr:Piso0_004088 [Millerozyma farinosa CBS 7064]CCE84541.1 Piso0_004088 [Millerozyma farinosa CBS 7064]
MAGRRNFYEKDDDIIAQPGVNVEISEKLKEQESPKGHISFIDGMGIRTLPYLEKYSTKLRLFVHEKSTYYGSELSNLNSAINNEFQTFQGEVKSLIKEPILPGGIYILTAALTGSIFARNRGIVLRFFTPVVFGGCAFKYFLPSSFNSSSEKLLHYEQKKYPEVYDKQNYYKQELLKLKNQSLEAVEDSKAELMRAVHSTRTYIADLLSK